LIRKRSHVRNADRRKPISLAIKEEAKKEAEELLRRGDHPGLAFILVGDDPLPRFTSGQKERPVPRSDSTR